MRGGGEGGRKWNVPASAEAPIVPTIFAILTAGGRRVPVLLVVLIVLNWYAMFFY